MKAAIAGFNRVIKRCPRCKADGAKEMVSKGRDLMLLCPECQHVFHQYRQWGRIVAILILAAVGAYWFFSPSPTPPPPSDALAAPAVRPVVETPRAPAARRSEADARTEAVRQYPQLGIAGSAFNTTFLQRVEGYRRTRPEFFSNPEWPLIVARETAETLR